MKSKAPAARWPLPDWEKVQPFPFATARGAFAGMTQSEDRIELEYYRRHDGSLVAIAKFGSLSEGAPGLVHGGAILTALDEALGAAAWLLERPVMTARLTTEFRKGVPVGATMLVETRFIRERHRLVLLEGTMTGDDGQVYAYADGRFMVLAEADQKRILGRLA
ncbi:MAG: PaaI family thioesterase [Elusimicrobiota bacterium]|nr:MAG: PaaI family thioesterase [Elusimicrobiota bacterium]